MRRTDYITVSMRALRASVLLLSMILYFSCAAVDAAENRSGVQLRAVAQKQKHDGFIYRAAATFAQIVHSNPRDAESLCDLAFCYSLCGEFDKALGSLKSLRANNVLSPSCTETIATTLINCGEFSDAIKVVNSKLKTSCDKAKLLHLRAQANFRLRNYTNCLADCKMISACIPASSAMHTSTLELEAQAFTAQEQFEKAQLCYAELIKTSPYNYVYYSKRASLLWLLNRKSAALEQFENVPPLMHLRADYLMAYIAWLDKHNLVNKTLTNLLQELDRVNLTAYPESMLQVARVFQSKKMNDQALAWTQRYIAARPASFEGYAAKAEIYYSCGRYTDGDKTVAAVSALLGECMRTQVLRLRLQRMRADVPISDKQLNELIAAKPKDVDEFIDRANLLFSCMKFVEQQITDWTTVCRIGDARQVTGSLLHSKIMLARQREADAMGINSAKRLAIIKPDPAHFDIAAGTVDHFGQHELAKTYSKMGIEIDPESTFNLFAMGRLLMFEQKFKEAIPYLVRATEYCSPSYVDPAMHLAQAYYLSARPVEAEAVIAKIKKESGLQVSMADIREKSIRFSSNPLVALKALLDSGKNSIKEEIAILQKKLSKCDAHSASKLHRRLGDLYFLRGNLKLALREYNLVPNRDVDFVLLSRKAAVYHAMHQRDLSRELREQSLQKYMENRSLSSGQKGL